MSLLEYFNTEIKPLNDELGRLLYDRDTKEILTLENEDDD